MSFLEPGVPREYTATGLLQAAGAPSITLKGVVLTADAAAAVAVLRSGGAGGTVVLTIKAPIQTSTVVPMNMAIQEPHLTLTGAAATFTANL